MTGKLDWAKIRSKDEATIERLAEEERRALGIRWEDFKFHRPFGSYLPNVKAIRRRLGLSQSEFAKRFCLSARTLQQWEQGRAKPRQHARVLLRIIECAPHIAATAVGGSVRAGKGRR